MYFQLGLLALIAVSANGFQEDISSLCISSPKLELIAGVTEVSALHDNSFKEVCRASLGFGNRSFPPITFVFDPTSCSGIEVPSFIVPPTAPNGDAYISWQCSGQSPTCVSAFIRGGEGVPDTTPRRNGPVGCSTSLEVTDAVGATRGCRGGIDGEPTGTGTAQTEQPSTKTGREPTSETTSEPIEEPIDNELSSTEQPDSGTEQPSTKTGREPTSETTSEPTEEPIDSELSSTADSGTEQAEKTDKPTGSEQTSETGSDAEQTGVSVPANGAEAGDPSTSLNEFGQASAAFRNPISSVVTIVTVTHTLTTLVTSVSNARTRTA